MKTTSAIIKGVVTLVLALPMAAGPAVAGSSLPLRHGVYVDASSECQGAPSAVQTWFGGGHVIHAPHASCTLRKIARQSRKQYLVTLRCNEYGAPDMSFVMIDRVTILSPTEYGLDNRFGRFTARWCRD